MRTRFRQLLRALKLPDQSTAGDRALDLGSLRAGGATHLLNLTEDSELVRRRGRWLASRTMEIYLQESAAVTFFLSQLPDTKARILQASQSFPEVSARARAFLRWSIPSESWWHLLTERQTGEMGVDEKFQCGSRQMGQPDSVQDANRRGARKRTVHLKSCK